MMHNIQYPEPKQEYEVLVRCFTYNQSKYIEDALTGFAMQQTDFSFVCLVMDDASTDGEQDVIKAWMERECDMSKAETIDIPTSVVIIVPHKTNSSCTFAFYLLKQNLYGTGDRKMNHVYPWRERCEYEALCEGDDYWIDPYKLQKQVDFLEANPEYGLVCSEVDIFLQKTGTFSYKFFRNSGRKIKYTFDDFLINGWFAAPCTWLYRKEYSNCNFSKYKFRVGDLPLLLEISANSKIYFFEESTAVYRILDNSASHFADLHSQEIFRKGILRIQLFFMDKYGRNELNGKILKRWLLTSAYISAKCGNLKKFFQYSYSLISLLLNSKTETLEQKIFVE